MKAAERRGAILQTLERAQAPMSATTLASVFSVSRQIIVGDIALLRAAGNRIVATPRGYLIGREDGRLLRQVACVHTGEEMERELQICVDQGCTVLDVVVEHPIYGQLTGQLQLSSRYDVQQFLKRVREESAHSLSELTDGIHLHTLRCPSQEAYQRVCQALDQAGILFKETV